MRIQKRNIDGFSLMEVVVSLVIVAIIGLTATGVLSQAVLGFTFSKDNFHLAMKAQLALQRMEVDLSNIDNATTPTGTSTSISYRSNFGSGVEAQRTIARSGSNLLLDTDILTDRVSGFTLEYLDSFNDATPDTTFVAATTKMIRITMQLSGANNAVKTFVLYVKAR